MMATDNVSHYGFDDRADRIFATMPQVSIVGENVAFISGVASEDIAQEFANIWYESIDHRENILDTYYQQTGIGLQIVWESWQPNYYAVQIFTN